VWVTTKNLKSSRPSHKLDYKQQGPYNVLAKKGHSYQLDLPPTMRVHSTFHAEKLRKDPNNPLPGQANPPPEPIQYGEEDEWEVEAVLNSSIRTRWNNLYYQVRWKGDGPEDSTWYKAADLKGSCHLLKQFHLDRPEAPGPPIRLERWIAEYEAGAEEFETHRDDNKPA
jgi:hypothetical protein